jgi:adenylosuccinate synthase
MQTGDSNKTNLISVMGISMGDEGKGRVVHELLEQIERDSGKPAAGVMKVNGGANAGHTAAGLKLNLLPSGIGNANIPKLLIGAGVVADPRKFLWEAKPLEARKLSVFSRLLVDEKTQVSDLSHRLLDLAWENYRAKQLGMESRGSTGRGISPAYSDETGQWQIFYLAFKQDRKHFASALKERVQRAVDTIRYVCKVSEEDWHSFFENLTESESRANKESLRDGIFDQEEFDFTRFKSKEVFDLDFDLLEEVYWQAGSALISCIGDVRSVLLESKKSGRPIVSEFGQAYWLDKRHGFTPNVTASHTTSAELFHSGGIPLQSTREIGCCKAYDTKVGTHHFLTKIDHESDPLGKKLAKLEFGTSTGRQRMVGWFDAVEKGNALRYGGFDELVINKLDALTLDDGLDCQLKICTAYRLPDGSLTTSIPRSEELRKTLAPVYETLDGWQEDISSISSYEKLPLNAKVYISRMIGSLLEVAYPDGYSNLHLPQIMFVGVGPDPGQIISDIPPTDKLIAEQSLARTPS